MWPELFNIVAPVFITVGIGFLWARMKLDFDATFVSRLVINVGSPALVFSGLSKMEASGDLFAILVFAAIATLLLLLAVNLLVLRLSGKPLGLWLQPLTFPNWGNLGLPICYFAYGDSGLALAIAFYAVSSTTQLTLGLLMASGSWRPMLLMRMPVVYAVGFALAFLSTETVPPRWLLNTTELVGGFMIPMMLLALGASLAGLKVTRLGQAAPFVIYRHALGLALGVGLAEALGLEGAAYGVVVIQGAMPIAVLNYLLAARFNHMPEFVASLVFLSTILTFVTIPVVLAFLI